MLTLNIGPLTLAMPHVILLGSLLLASLVGWRVGRRSGRNPERQLFRLLLVAVLVARLAFVATYWAYYRDDWLSVIDIRDGGFIAWPGLVAALALGIWWGWRDSGLRRPLGIALTVGVLSWGFGNLAWYSFEQGTRLPEMALRDSQGRPVALEDYAGQPLVINLWATWCPPCRREMPVLAEAQARESDTLFLFVNQGEGRAKSIVSWSRPGWNWTTCCSTAAAGSVSTSAPRRCPPHCSTTPRGARSAAISANSRTPAWRVRWKL